MGEVQAVLVAGGRASRMGQFGNGRPKALLPFGTTSLLAHHLRALHAHGIRRAIILGGHSADVIQAELPGAAPAGMSVDLVVEPAPSGSGGCLRHLPASQAPLLVVFADVMAWMDYAALVERHCSAGALITAVVHPTDHPADSDLVETDAFGWVIALRRKPRPSTVEYRNLAVAGVFVLEPPALARLAPAGQCDLVHDLIDPTVEAGGRVLAYRTTEYLKDCGTPERYSQVQADFKDGRVHTFYRANLRPALFIDRDGTVNRYVGYVTKPEQLELLPGAGAAIRKLNHAGILAVLVTNQPVVARGECSAAGLELIHARLETLLAKEGAILDGVYACPHHPDQGFPGEVSKLKIACDCRKPKPGLVHRAVRELPVDLRRSAVVGDSERDVALAGRLNLTAFRIAAAVPPHLGGTQVRDLAEAVDRWLDAVGASFHATEQ